MIAVESEQPAAILQWESHADHGHSRAKSGEVALNQRRDVALFVHGSEVGGIAHCRHAGGDVARRGLRLDQLRALARIVLGEQSVDWNLGEFWIGVVAI